MHFHGKCSLTQRKELSFGVYTNISLHEIQCSAVIDFATCKQFIKLIHMLIQPEIIFE